MTPYQTYRAAQLAARRLMGELDRHQLQKVVLALEQYAHALDIAIRQGGDLATLSASRRAALAAARVLDKALAEAVAQGRRVAFDSVLHAWQVAMEQVAAEAGVSMATLGRVRGSATTMLGQLASLGSAPWRTVIRTDAIGSAEEVSRIIMLATQAGTGPEELARRLRKYVTGAEDFQQAFQRMPTRDGGVAEKLDVRKIPLAERGATRAMVHNARRIAFSEPHNARAEAEIGHMRADPFVEAVRWTLSPVRSTVGWVPPDECDFLARNDVWGLGSGVYPVNNVPPPPHPWDRCEKMPVIRPASQIRDERPRGTRPSRASVMDGDVPDEHRLTPGAAARIRENAWAAISFPMQAARSAQRAG